MGFNFHVGAGPFSYSTSLSPRSSRITPSTEAERADDWHLIVLGAVLVAITVVLGGVGWLLDGNDGSAAMIVLGWIAIWLLGGIVFIGVMVHTFFKA